MKQYVQQIIKNSLLRLNEENELKRVTLSNILHINIDILINQSFVWFKDEVPSDYKSVLHSLLTLATTLFDEKSEISEIILDREYKEVNVFNLMERIAKEFQSMFLIEPIKINFTSENNIIVIDQKIFTDSIYHLFLSVYLFMNEKSSCSINIIKDSSNVNIEIKFLDLIQSFPGVNKIQKVFFTYYEDSKYNVGVGLSTPINSLRELGGIVYVRNFTGDNNMVLNISFPSLEFLKTIDEIRAAENHLNKHKLMHGNILIIVKDVFLEIVLKEMLHDVGYVIRKIQINELENFETHDRYKCVIIDYACIKEKFLKDSFFKAYALLFKKIIIIFDEIEHEAYSENYKSEFITLKKPVEIDEIINQIEGVLIE